MFLVLMRSGECQALDIGGRDSDRALTDKGVREAVSSAIFLSSLGVEPRAILASPFKRTRQTADILSEHLPENPQVIVAPYIMPGAGPEEIIRSVKARTNCSEKDCVIAVCHEPDISKTTMEIAHFPQNAFIPMEPGSLVGVNLSCSDGRIHGHLVFFFSPRSMNINQAQ